MRASATAGESTYAGIIRLVTAAQTAKSPFIRLADRYAILLLEVPENIRETMGSGLEGRIGGRRVHAGSHQLVYGARRPEDWAVRVLRRASWRSALSVFVSVDGRTIGALLLGDELRRETLRTVHKLRRAGVSRIIMITGDRADAAETIGAALDLDAVLAERVPSDKVDAVATERRLRPTLMVGDGINDAPALAALMSASPWAREGRAPHPRLPLSLFWWIDWIRWPMPS
jgi:cation transport ATPase